MIAVAMPRIVYACCCTQQARLPSEEEQMLKNNTGAIKPPLNHTQWLSKKDGVVETTIFHTWFPGANGLKMGPEGFSCAVGTAGT